MPSAKRAFSGLQDAGQLTALFDAARRRRLELAHPLTRMTEQSDAAQAAQQAALADILAGIEDEGVGLDEEADSILSPSAQRLFASDRFRRESGARPVYVLRNGEYLFIDPSLRPALDVVRKLQDAPEAQRRAFVLNPRKVMRETLGEDESEAIGLEKASLDAANWRDAGVVLTTYETLRDYHFSFARTRFGLIIYDEIQKLKNPGSQMTRAAKALNSEFTLGMTGTPVENRLQDLWSIMDVVAPGFLGASRDFERRHPSDDNEALARLKSQLTDAVLARPPYMLRRMKGEVLDGMPTKTVHVLEQEMPPIRDLVIRAAAAGAAGNLGKGGMLTTLANMRGVSLHPVDPRYAPDDLDAYAEDSARLAQALLILEKVAAAKEKALIFVEDLAMQDRLASLISAPMARYCSRRLLPLIPMHRLRSLSSKPMRCCASGRKITQRAASASRWQ